METKNIETYSLLELAEMLFKNEPDIRIFVELSSFLGNSEQIKDMLLEMYQGILNNTLQEEDINKLKDTFRKSMIDTIARLATQVDVQERKQEEKTERANELQEISLIF